MSLRLRVVLVYPDKSYSELSNRQTPDASIRSLNSRRLDYIGNSPSPSLTSYQHDYKEFKRFLHLTDPRNSLKEACDEILERYNKLYPDDKYVFYAFDYHYYYFTRDAVTDAVAVGH